MGLVIGTLLLTTKRGNSVSLCFGDSERGLIYLQTLFAKTLEQFA